MKLAKLGMIAAAAIAFGAMPAKAQFPHLSLMGGVSFPKGDASQMQDMGYNGGMALGFNAPMMPIGIRLDAALHHFPGKDLTINGSSYSQSTNVWSGTVNATYSLPLPSPVKPYAIAGLGYYGTIVTIENVPGNASQSKLGYNAGVGVALSRLFVEMRYHHVNTDGSALTFMPLTFGITF
jgi:opacity protein-like surface antigen